MNPTEIVVALVRVTGEEISQTEGQFQEEWTDAEWIVYWWLFESGEDTIKRQHFALKGVKHDYVLPGEKEDYSYRDSLIAYTRMRGATLATSALYTAANRFLDAFDAGGEWLAIYTEKLDHLVKERDLAVVKDAAITPPNVTDR